MKVFQIENNICYWDASNKFPTVESTVGYFPPELLFVEAPNYVFEGWGYIDGEFIQPTAPDGWIYNENTGTFYPEDYDINMQSDEPDESNSALDILLDALIS